MSKSADPFLTNAYRILILIIMSSLVVIIISIVYNINYFKTSVATNGKVIGMVQKTVSSGGNFATRPTPAHFPIIEFEDTDGNIQTFTSSYSYSGSINNTIPIRYRIHNNKYIAKPDIFTVNWFFAIFAFFILLVSIPAAVIVNNIKKFYHERAIYLDRLKGVSTAVVTHCEPFEGGWNIILEAKLPEFPDKHFEFKETTYNVDNTKLDTIFTVKYDPADVIRSYLIEFD